MKRHNLLAVLVIFFSLTLFVGASASSSSAYIITHEYFIQTQTGMTIHTVEKRLVMQPKHAVLLIHGSGVGYPYFDIPIRDYSMADALARKGFAVYMVDQRGFGLSTQPNGLTVRAEDSADDLKSVIDFIKTRNKKRFTTVDIVGHSWGAVVCAVLAGKYPQDIGKVVLLGFTYKKLNAIFQPGVNALIQQAKAGVDYVTNTTYIDIEKRGVYLYDQDVIDWYKAKVAASYPTIPTGPFLDLENFEHSDYIPHLTAPTLQVDGVLEYVVDLSDAIQCQKDLGAATGDRTIKKDLLLLGNAFHIVFLEELDHVRLNNALVTWLTN